jgi:hypothetical protein
VGERGESLSIQCVGRYVASRTMEGRCSLTTVSTHVYMQLRAMECSMEKGYERMSVWCVYG